MLFGQHFDGELPRKLDLRQFENSLNKQIGLFMFKNQNDVATLRYGPLSKKTNLGACTKQLALTVLTCAFLNFVLQVEILTGARVSDHRDKMKNHCLAISVPGTTGSNLPATGRNYIISFNSWSEQERWKNLIPKVCVTEIGICVGVCLCFLSFVGC